MSDPLDFRTILCSLPSPDAPHKYSAIERKRRQIYRGEVHGQLPFDTRGMDEAVPTLDFSPSGPGDVQYSLEREDVNGQSMLC
jgi:hypothetical protein